jgi:hypothetical protein
MLSHHLKETKMQKTLLASALAGALALSVGTATAFAQTMNDGTTGTNGTTIQSQDGTGTTDTSGTTGTIGSTDTTANSTDNNSGFDWRWLLPLAAIPLIVWALRRKPEERRNQTQYHNAEFVGAKGGEVTKDRDDEFFDDDTRQNHRRF